MGCGAARHRPAKFPRGEEHSGQYPANPGDPLQHQLAEDDRHGDARDGEHRPLHGRRQLQPELRVRVHTMTGALKM